LSKPPLTFCKQANLHVECISRAALKRQTGTGSPACLRCTTSNSIRAVFIDITAQRLAEEGIRYVMANVQGLLWYALVEAAPDVADEFRWDLRVFDEDAAQRFFPLDLQPGQSYTRAWTECKLPEDQQATDEVSSTALRSSQSDYTQEFRCRRADGNVRWIREQVHLEMLSPGKWRLAGIATDVTDYKRLEDELRRKSEELIAADRQKDNFLTSLAHELRNSLGPVLNAAQLLQMARIEDERIQRAAGVTERQARQMARLVDDLLDVSRIVRGQIVLRREPADLRDIARHAVETIRPTIDSRAHQLTVALPEQPVPVKVDAERMEQVLVNLLSNSAKYTEPGGRIRLSVEVDGGIGSVRVADNGTGMSPEMLPRVFDLYMQADRTLPQSQLGLGIGPTLVKRLVEMHGGAVEVRSEGQGHGAEFTVTIPLTRRTSTSLPATDGHIADPHTSAQRILLVDDNVDLCRTLADLLEYWGYEVLSICDGSRAEQIAREYLPMLAILNLGLPGLDGCQLATGLRGDPTTAHIRLIAISGSGAPDTSARALANGFDLFLAKPVEPGCLQEAVSELLSFSPTA
jgi:signal transduction histidine kinase